jgi:hypothetical protein
LGAWRHIGKLDNLSVLPLGWEIIGVSDIHLKALSQLFSPNKENFECCIVLSMTQNEKT